MDWSAGRRTPDVPGKLKGLSSFTREEKQLMTEMRANRGEQQQPKQSLGTWEFKELFLDLETRICYLQVYERT